MVSLYSTIKMMHGPINIIHLTFCTYEQEGLVVTDNEAKNSLFKEHIKRPFTMFQTYLNFEFIISKQIYAPVTINKLKRTTSGQSVTTFL